MAARIWLMAWARSLNTVPKCSAIWPGGAGAAKVAARVCCWAVCCTAPSSSACSVWRSWVDSVPMKWRTDDAVTFDASASTVT